MLQKILHYLQRAGWKDVQQKVASEISVTSVARYYYKCIESITPCREDNSGHQYAFNSQLFLSEPVTGSKWRGHRSDEVKDRTISRLMLNRHAHQTCDKASLIVAIKIRVSARFQSRHFIALQ